MFFTIQYTFDTASKEPTKIMFEIKVPPPVSPFKNLKTVFKLGAFVGSPFRALNGDYSSGHFEITSHPRKKFWAFLALLYFTNALVIVYWHAIGYDYSLILMVQFTKFGK